MPERAPTATQAPAHAHDHVVPIGTYVMVFLALLYRQFVALTDRLTATAVCVVFVCVFALGQLGAQVLRRKEICQITKQGLGHLGTESSGVLGKSEKPSERVLGSLGSVHSGVRETPGAHRALNRGQKRFERASPAIGELQAECLQLCIQIWKTKGGLDGRDSGGDARDRGVGLTVGELGH